MHIPGLGAVAKDEFGHHVSAPTRVPLLGDKGCRVTVENYEDDPDPSAVHAAIANFLAAGPDVLRDASRHVFHYYCDVRDLVGAENVPLIESPADVWAHVQLGTEPVVTRRGSSADRSVYISLECNCDWEPEHGLHIVLRDGLVISMVGPYDGCLTHADPSGDDLEGVIYPLRSR